MSVTVWRLKTKIIQKENRNIVDPLRTIYDILPDIYKNLII